MRIIKSEYVVPFDVDSTLILPNDGKYKGLEVQVYDSVESKQIAMIAHEPNIRLLKEEKHRGAFVIVWSRGGHEWASNVVRALQLESYVDLILSKPLVYFDDLDVSKWLPYRVWLEPDTIYKK